MDRATVKALRAELEALVSEGTKVRYELSMGSATFNPRTGEATFKITLREKNAKVAATRAEDAIAEWNARERGTALEGKLGTTFKHGRRTYTLQGHTRTGQLLATRDDGREFRFPRASALLILGLPYENTPASRREEARREAKWEARVS